MSEVDKETKLHGDIFMFLHDHAYRTDATKDEKRIIRRKASSIVLRDGLLYFKHKGAERQWIVNKDSQMKVIVSCHDQALGGGHFGRDKTIHKICSRFYWRDMTKFIKEYVRTCVQCQKTNPKLHKEASVLHPIAVKAEVWHQIGIDLVGPLKLTRKGNRYAKPY